MKALVLWYSRSGNTTKVAREIGRALDEESDVEVEMQEIKEVGVEREGAMGWLMGGRDAMLKREVQIRPVLFDVADFDIVVIGTPVWAFTMAPAVRVVCEEQGRAAKHVAFFCTMGAKGDERTFRAMAEACRKKPADTLVAKDAEVHARDKHQIATRAKAFARKCAAAVRA